MSPSYDKSYKNETDLIYYNNYSYFITISLTIYYSQEILGRTVILMCLTEISTNKCINVSILQILTVFIIFDETFKCPKDLSLILCSKYVPN